MKLFSLQISHRIFVEKLFAVICELFAFCMHYAQHSLIVASGSCNQTTTSRLFTAKANILSNSTVEMNVDCVSLTLYAVCVMQVCELGTSVHTCVHASKHVCGGVHMCLVSL